MGKIKSTLDRENFLYRPLHFELNIANAKHYSQKETMKRLEEQEKRRKVNKSRGTSDVNQIVIP